MHNCDHYLPLIHMYLDDELDKDERDALLEHLDYCEHCNSLMEDYRRISGELRTMTEAPPATLHHDIMAHIARRKTLPFWQRRAVRRVTALATCAAVLGLVAVGGWRAGLGGSAQNLAGEASTTAASARAMTGGGVRPADEEIEAVEGGGQAADKAEAMETPQPTMAHEQAQMQDVAIEQTETQEQSQTNVKVDETADGQQNQGLHQSFSLGLNAVYNTEPYGVAETVIEDAQAQGATVILVAAGDVTLAGDIATALPAGQLSPVGGVYAIVFDGQAGELEQAADSLRNAGFTLYSNVTAAGTESTSEPQAEPHTEVQDDPEGQAIERYFIILENAPSE